jgi:hypothetical protein
MKIYNMQGNEMRRAVETVAGYMKDAGQQQP